MKENMVNKIKNGIVWIRTPKCSTSTIRVHLQRFSNWMNLKITDSFSHDSFPLKKFINLGHLWAEDVNWDVVKNDNRFVMGSIRNPLDRFLSHYKHHLREGRYPQYDNDVSSFYLENYHNTHFEPYFRGMDNYLCKYLGIGDDKSWNKDLILDRYDFFTVTEYLKESLVKFENITGYSFEDKDLVKNNTEYSLILTDEFINKFKELNKNDFDLYEFILKKYEYK